MKRYFLTLFFALLLASCSGQTNKEKYGRPIIALIETDPWLMVIGSDVPTFALYENGQIIYKKIVDKQIKYYEVTNDKETTQKIIKSFGITDNLMKQEDYIVASTATDQPTNVLLLNFDLVRQLSVYGQLRDLKNKARQKTPIDFIDVYDKIIKFEDNKAIEWLPDTFEVMATKYSYAPEKSLKWNSEWNDIKSETTVKRNEDLYSIYLEKKYYKEFIELLKNTKEKQSVEINGEKYSLTYRLPFPNL
nr:lipoprotein [uncultured Flavobacterium sp.]